MRKSSNLLYYITKAMHLSFIYSNTYSVQHKIQIHFISFNKFIARLLLCIHTPVKHLSNKALGYSNLYNLIAAIFFRNKVNIN